ncbi:MAG: ATP synthase F1 subunit epsilon [Treponema sp.]|jgi:F-type H+-transporting ATPase subunit epsilon|nr:ATP synthase F1 subunit epsilon [Treponema sp.]
MAVLFPFEVHTPYRRFFADSIEALVITLIDGEIGVYANRSPFTAPVVTGIMRVKDQDGRWRSAFTTEGILEVKERKTVLMVDAAEWPEEIDRDRALAAKQQAEEMLKSNMLKFEADRALSSLARANFRLRVWELGDKKAENLSDPPVKNK